MDPDSRAIVIAALPNRQEPGLVDIARKLSRKVIERFPLATGPDSTNLARIDLVDPRESGCRWQMGFDAFGRQVRCPQVDQSHAPKATVRRMWEVAVSFRGPLLAVLDRAYTGEFFETCSVTDGELVAWASNLAAEFNLHLVEAAELLAWQVDAEEMTQEMWCRLDYTDRPSAFQLLFSED